MIADTPVPPNHAASAALIEKIGLIFAALPRVLMLTLVVAGVIVVSFAQTDNQAAITAWALAAILVVAVRALIWRGWQRDPNRFDHVRRWRVWLAIGSFLSGALWGAVSVAFFPEFDLPRQTLLALLICGACASAAVTAAPDRLIAYLFLLPCLVPTIVQFQLHFMQTGYSVALLGLLYAAIVADAIHRIGKYIDDNIQLRLALEERESRRRQFERELGDSRQKLQALFALSPLGCMLIREDEEIIDSNAALQRMLGYGADQLKEIGGRALVAAHEHMKLQRRWQSVDSENHTSSFEQQYICSDGTTIDAMVHHMTFGHRHGQRYAWEIIEDITARKSIEKRMLEDRAKLQAFVQYTPSPVVMLDRDLKCIACTPSWARMNDVDPENAIGRHLYELYSQMPEEYKAVHQRCLAGAIERRAEELFTGQTGAQMWLHWEVRPWYERDDVIGGIMILNENITPRKRAEIEARERDMLLQRLTERVPGVLYQFRCYPDGGRKSSYVSAAVRTIFEVEVEDVYNDHAVLGARIEPADRELVRAGLAEAVRTMSIWQMDYRVQLPTRGLRWLHTEAVGELQADGSSLWHSYVADVTELKQAQEQLQMLNHRFALAVDAALIGVWEWNLVEDTLVWDERMYEIHNLPKTQPITSEQVNQLAHPDDWQQAYNIFVAALNDPTADRYEVEYRVLWNDNSEHAVCSAGLLQRNAEGQAERAIGVTWDITESKKVERMKTEFVSMVSHELRTPLTSIRGSLALLERGIGGAIAPEAKELIDVAYKNSERLSLLINDILDIEKIESDKIRFDMKRYSLRSLVEQGVAANRGYAQTYDIALHLLEPIADLDIVVDSNRFMQVLANLISNAVKFSPPHGEVEIAVLPANDSVRIEVRDRGPGIPAEFQSRMFLRFSQADTSNTRAKGGSGLGLSITKSIIEKMHGEIGFAARDGGGTVFFFTLPRAP